jgi:5-methylcytosine-specific restriction endonuclease McrA
MIQEREHSHYDHSNGILSGRVLILNQSYEPLSVCSAKKALILLFLTKAELVEYVENKVVRSVNHTYHFPSVIRLSHYLHIPFRKIELSRKNILRRDGMRCQYCGQKTKELTLDHIMPKSRDGLDSWLNLTAACKKCNNKKGNRTPEEAKMPLLSLPMRPHHIMTLTQFMVNIDEKWKPFLFLT